MKSLTLMSFFIFIVFSSSASCRPSKDLPSIRDLIKLNSRQGDWELTVSEEYASGAPKVVIFYKSERANDQKIPVKKMEYDCSGALTYETDLILLDENDPIVKETGERIQPHGPCISFTSSGSIDCIYMYDKGLLRGPTKQYYSDGVLRSRIHYENGLKQGLAEQFYQNGRLKERATYVLNHPFGIQEEWNEDGTLKAKYNYVNGLLHDDNDSPASIQYYSNKTVQEEKHYLNGLAHGLHRKFYDDGTVSYCVTYFFGNKNGVESFYFQNEIIEGEGRYIKGTPVGRHYRKHENGGDALVANYDSLGKLKEPIVEFDSEGNKRAEYNLVEGEYQGELLEWYPGEVLKKEYHYDNDEFEGEQVDYFPSSNVKMKITYHHRVLHGKNEMGC
ncbi:MAG: hypothetical protein VX777_09185 [Chlamydiota bacterium]|nr:hypothetical protein [Chlamydiota bacterium]